MIHPHAKPVRRGFSFIEILFAVMVLGIGFIMIAAIFPVAIRQAQGTVEDTATGRVLRNAATQLPSLVTFNDSSDFTGAAGAPGVYLAARDPRQPNTAPPLPALPPTQFWNLTKGSFIDAGDPRFAWTFLYRRDRVAVGVPPPPSILYVVTTVRNRPAYDAKDLFRFDTPTTVDDTDEKLPWATLQPKIVRVVLIDNGDTDTVEVLPAAGTGYPLKRVNPIAPYTPTNVPLDEVPDFTEAVGEGSFIVISDDNVSPPYTNAPFSPLAPYVPGTLNGRIYRVGGLSSNAPVNAGAKVWELIPGNNMGDARENLPLAAADRNDPSKAAIAFVFGKAFGEVTDPSTGFQGRVQDLFVRPGGL